MRRASSARPRRDVSVVGALVLLFIVLPAFFAWAAGALWIPHNDSWAHSRIAAHLSETGSLELIGFNRASMVGMMAPLVPFGSGIVVHHLFVMGCGAAVLGFTYCTARRVLGMWAAAAVCVLVGLAPGFVLLSTSYMTDVPMMAAIAASLYFGARFLETGRAGLLMASVLAAVWGVTVREQALAALAAVALTAWTVRKDRRVLVAAVTVAALILIAAFEVWRRAQAGDDPPQLALNPMYTLRSTVMAAMTLAFVCAPALIAGVRRPQGRLGCASVGIAGAFGAALMVFLGPGMLLGNYFAPEGAYAAMLHGTRSTLPMPLMWAAAALAVTALTAAATRVPRRSSPLCVRRGRQSPVLALLGTFVLVYAAGTVLQTLSGQAMFERYFYPLVLPVGVLCLRRAHPARISKGIAAVAGIVLCVAGTLTAAHTWASTGAVWREAEALVSSGMSPRDIDAGFAWVGFHSELPLADEQARSGTVGWWAGQFLDSRQCVIVSLGSPVADGGATTALTYPKYIVAGTDEVVIQTLPACR